MRSQRFKETECRLTGVYLARLWLAQVLRFSDPETYTSWFGDDAQSGAAWREFMAHAAEVIERLPPLYPDDKERIVNALSASFARFRNGNEEFARKCAELSIQFEAVLLQLCEAAKKFGIDPDCSAVFPQRPWLPLEETSAVARALSNQVITWDRLKQLFGLEEAALAQALEGPPQKEELRTGSNASGSQPCTQSGGSVPQLLLQAIRAGEITSGTMIQLPTSPVAVLRNLPVLRGGAVDAFSLRLAEYGARLNENSQREGGSPSKPNRPIIHSVLWSDIGEEFSQFAEKGDEDGQAKAIYLKDYVAYCSCRGRADLRVIKGVAVSSLQRWLVSDFVRIMDQLPERSAGDGGIKLPIDRPFAELAMIWPKQLDEIAAAASQAKVCGETGARQVGEDGLFASPADGFDLLMTWAPHLSSFCIAMLPLAYIPRGPQAGGDPNDQETSNGPGQSAEAADRLKAPLLFLGRVAQEQSETMEYLLLRTVLALHQDGYGPYGARFEQAAMAGMSTTFDEIIQDMRNQLGLPPQIKSREFRRAMDDLKMLNRLIGLR